MRQLLALSIVTCTSTLTALAQNAGDYRTAASGNWNGVGTWETFDGSGWVAASVTPTAANAGVITIQSPHCVTNSASVSADQIVVAPGATLAASSTLTVANGEGVDLDVSGTLLALGGSSVFTLQASVEVVVGAGGVFAHNGTSSACVKYMDSSATITFASGGWFLLQRSGGTVPLATWSDGSTCEISYGTASTSRPATAGMVQIFKNFIWNNPLQSGGIDLGGSLTNINGNFLIAATAGYEVKWNGDANFGANLTVSNGSLNVSGSSATRQWTLKGDLLIASGADFNLSAGSGSSYTLTINGSGTQNYTCNGTNRATKLNWTVDDGSTLNLNSDLPLTTAGRTLTANGTVNLNGHVVSADLLGGTGTVRNQGGGSGLLAVGAGNGNVTLGGTLALLDGASGSLGLVKRGTGSLNITVAQTFSGGLVVSNGTALVNNTTGSGTGSGAVEVYGGTLGGDGILSGVVSIASGATVSPGASTGRLTINNTVTLAGNTAIEVDKVGGTNDVLAATTVNYGGTLTVIDVSGGLVAGDSFKIVNAGSHSANFTSIIGSPGAGFEWRFDPATGVLSVVGATPEPPPLAWSYSGSAITFSWTATAYKLQSQTNSLTTGLSTNWSDLAGGSSSPVMMNINTANGSVFFRLAPQ